jgi:hypothetical protein
MKIYVRGVQELDLVMTSSGAMRVFDGVLAVEEIFI